MSKKPSENLEEKFTLKDSLTEEAGFGCLIAVFLTYETVQGIKHAYYHLKGVKHCWMNPNSDWNFPYCERELSEEEVKKCSPA